LKAVQSDKAARTRSKRSNPCAALTHVRARCAWRAPRRRVGFAHVLAVRRRHHEHGLVRRLAGAATVRTRVGAVAPAHQRRTRDRGWKTRRDDLARRHRAPPWVQPRDVADGPRLLSNTRGHGAGARATGLREAPRSDPRQPTPDVARAR